MLIVKLSFVFIVNSPFTGHLFGAVIVYEYSPFGNKIGVEGWNVLFIPDIFIFAFGIYELFISEIDEANESEVGSQILAIHSLDELKSKLGNVIVMVLIVIFFKKVIHMHFETPLDMLYLAGGIFALALSLYYMHKAHEGEH